jgi:pilus assembly protein FimV
MRITCESCTTTFNLDERLLNPSGSKVRCSKCRHVFVALPPEVAEPIPESLVSQESPMTEDDSPPEFESEPELSDLEKMLGPLSVEVDESVDADEPRKILSDDSDAEKRFAEPLTEDSDSLISGAFDDSFAVDLDDLNESGDTRPADIPLSDTPEWKTGKDSNHMESTLEAPDMPETTLSGSSDDELGIDTVGLQGIETPRRVHPFLLVLLVLALILGIAYWGSYWAHRNHMEIPLVSQLGSILFDRGAPSELKDPGARGIATSDINSKIIENRTAGKLFVITGKIRNDYDNPRGIIQIKGDLFTEGQKHVKTTSVYCGNVLSDLDLAVMGIEAIRQRLGNRFGGDGKANLKVMPKQTLPFMIVFDNLPEGLEEFTLEVLGSIPM